MGILPQEILKKMGYLRPHFVRFEDSLLGNKPYKDEGSKDNNSGTFLNSKLSFGNRTLGHPFFFRLLSNAFSDFGRSVGKEKKRKKIGKGVWN